MSVPFYYFPIKSLLYFSSFYFLFYLFSSILSFLYIFLFSFILFYSFFFSFPLLFFIISILFFTFHYFITSFILIKYFKIDLQVVVGYNSYRTKHIAETADPIWKSNAMSFTNLLSGTYVHANLHFYRIIFSFFVIFSSYFLLFLFLLHLFFQIKLIIF